MKFYFILAMLMCCLAGTVWAQTRQVSGTILDNQTGQALQGASVMQKGTNNGTLTNASGNFTLTIPAQGEVVLTVSFSGYTMQEITVTNQTNLRISLSGDVTQLGDVVVVGYGTVKKKDLTGAVGSIKASDIVRGNPVNATKGIQGQVAGVVITKANNQPGQGFNIDIRGENTITGVTEPLVVIDGVIGGRLSDINPADIEKIDILKDASSTAIYGSRGANGVVIITSKKGASGKPRVTLDSYVGLKTPGHLMELQNAQQFYKTLTTDRAANGGTPANFTVNELEIINSGRNTDWVDLITDNGIQTGSTIAVSGGSDNTTYRFSGGYIKEDGSLMYTNFKKYNLNAGLESRINNFIKVGFTAYVNYSEQATGSRESLRSASRSRPTGTVYWDDLVNPSDGYDAAIDPWNGLATWMGIKDNQVMNPLIEVNKANSQYQVNIANQMGNAYAEIALFKGLTFRSSISASVISEKQGDFRGTYSKDRIGTRLPRAFYNSRDFRTYTLDNILTYNLSKGDHKLTVTALQSAYKNIAETSTINVDNLPFQSLWYNVGSAGTITGIASSYAQNTLQSYMGRVNYSFKNKYLLTLTGRSDGASQLSEGNKWAFFPSAAVAWRLDEENFIKNINVISGMKLRVSYGQVGNATVNPYSTQAAILNTAYDFGNTAAFGFAPANLGNKDLKWERSEELNIGLDMGFLNNRITATVEVYDRKTRDLILNQNIPSSTGFSTVFANVGKVGNKGIEISLNTVNISKKDFSWATSINFSKNTNKILALASGVSQDIGNSLFVGYSVRSLYYYQFAGIWQIPDSIDGSAGVYGQRPGSVRVVDQNKDGKISSSAGIDDRVVLGNELPDWVMGMTNRVRYKNFDFSVFMYTSQGVLFRNNILSGTFGDYSNTRYNHIVLNYWRRDNPTNEYYDVSVSNPYRQAIQYEKANFVKISDITLGYTIPPAKLSRLGINGIRVYGQVNNPFVFSKYHGPDPEYNSNDYIDDVPTIIYTFGVNVSF
ncbi:MAG: SusC/RagA family TonB-linked outer membrane protein [Terrimonas sp.]|nr:SusC/RagA family TonB-linked outer membrane protein [Terrimonas sp.]